MRFALAFLMLFLVAASDPPADRLSMDRMEELVGPFVVQAEGGDVDAAVAAFEADLARRTDPTDIADRLQSFGALLFSRGAINSDEALQRRSLVFLERAIPAYGTAFAPDHPEVALALNSYADVLMEVAPEARGRAIDAYEDALRIRESRLGPDDPQTAATLSYLARALHDPGSRSVDPQARARAIALFRRAEQAMAGNNSRAGAAVRVGARAGLAAIFIRTGDMSDAVAAIDRMLTDRSGPGCLNVASASMRLVRALDQVGKTAQANRLRNIRGFDCL